jgi:hypothetical protein
MQVSLRKKRLLQEHLINFKIAPDQIIMTVHCIKQNRLIHILNKRPLIRKYLIELSHLLLKCFLLVLSYYCHLFVGDNIVYLKSTVLKVSGVYFFSIRKPDVAIFIF